MTGFEPVVNKVRGNLIKVIGVGGGGSNAVNHMFRHGIEGVDFYICNTDLQSLHSSPIPNRLQLGAELTEGLGAGSMPNMGEKAAMENMAQIRQIMEDNTKMVFITAGMGGGTGTGAAPVIAKIAKELSILTVGIVTLPFEDEGPQRINQAREGLEKLRPHVDALLTICNDRIVDMYGDLSITQAFSKADDILCTAVRGIAEIITKPGQINVDFMDVQTAMRDSGRAIMGTGIAAGENRAENAVRMALDSPLLDNTRIQGAQHLLVNFTYGHKEPVMSEISKVKKYLQEEAGNTAHLKMGITKDDSLGDDIAITVIATGFESRDHVNANLFSQQQEAVNAAPVAPATVVQNPYGFNGGNPNLSERPAFNTGGFQSGNPNLSKPIGSGLAGNNGLPNNNAWNQPPSGNPLSNNENNQANLFSIPQNPSVINHVPSSFGNSDSDEDPMNPIDVTPKPFTAEDPSEDPSAQVFRDTHLENGRSHRETLLDSDIDVPAYMRRGINLEAAPHSQSQLVSKITIGEEDPMNASDLTVKPNRHLHDNVD
ncbi:MAG: cell division protein FtsZ [Bacteroidetes bacterium]|nr:cell division protein FtsZ [Bacteroidota bacterium]MDA1225170.1 cell division protein FtsZ [Bacteroidota bacterium]